MNEFERVWQEYVRKYPNVLEGDSGLVEAARKACSWFHEQGYIAGTKMQRRLTRLQLGLSEEWDK